MEVVNPTPEGLPETLLPAAVTRMAALWALGLTGALIGFAYLVITSSVLPGRVLNFDSIYVVIAGLFYIWLFQLRFRPGLKAYVIGFNLFIVFFLVSYGLGLAIMLLYTNLGSQLVQKLGGQVSNEDLLGGIILQAVLGKLFILMLLIIFSAGFKALAIRLAR